MGNFSSEVPWLFKKIPIDLPPFQYKYLKAQLKAGHGHFVERTAAAHLHAWCAAASELHCACLFVPERDASLSHALAAYAELCIACLQRLVCAARKLCVPLACPALADFEASVGRFRAYQRRHVPVSENGDGVECPICLEVPEQVVLPVCEHRMCRVCFEHLRAPQCPICRRPLLLLGTAPKKNQGSNHKRYDRLC